MIPIQWNASDSESNYSFTTLNLKHYHRFVSPEATRSERIIVLVRTYRASSLQREVGNQAPMGKGRNWKSLKQAGWSLGKEWSVHSGRRKSIICLSLGTWPSTLSCMGLWSCILEPSWTESSLLPKKGAQGRLERHGLSEPPCSHLPI